MVQSLVFEVELDETQLFDHLEQLVNKYFTTILQLNTYSEEIGRRDPKRKSFNFPYLPWTHLKLVDFVRG